MEYEVSVFLTLDFYISVYERKEKRYLKKIVSLPIEKITLNRNPNSLEIRYSKNQLLWNSKVTLKILMENHDLDTLFF